MGDKNTYKILGLETARVIYLLNEYFEGYNKIGRKETYFGYEA